MSYMDITYLGHASFKIKGKQTSVVIDPYDSSVLGMKFPKVDADIVTVSHHHPDHDSVSNVTPITDKIHIVDGPGEYEIKGVSIIGISTFHDDKKGEERGKNTAYVIEIDGLRLLHIGDLGHKLDDSSIKEIGNIDILFLPVGGTYTIDSKTAVDVMKQIGPSIVVPMHYKLAGVDNEILNKLAPVDEFITASGLRVENLPKLTIKEGDIKSDDEYAVVLEKK